MQGTLKNRLNFRQQARYALDRAKGISIETDLNRYLPVIDKIKSYKLNKHTDSQLQQIIKETGIQIQKGADMDAQLPIVYAVVYETVIRTLGITPYDEQLLAAIVLHQGKLAQMQTGEGKTMAIAFAAVLESLAGQGVHILTANDYLAKRDAQWMGAIYNLLGLTACYVQDSSTHKARADAYLADITYLTAREAGFDFLRDQLVYDPQAQVQRSYNMAIVDEADFILIDEARIPLVIAGSAGEREIDPHWVETLLPQLIPGMDFLIDKNWRRIYLNLNGQEKVQRITGSGGIHEEQCLPLYAAINVGLHAHYLLTKDVDYIVREKKIELIDEFTGRIADRRRWPYGIQAALEAKEHLALQPEGKIFGSITIQYFLNQYPKIAALTATAVSAARELLYFYGLTTVLIPSHKPVIRRDAPDRVFKTRAAKFRAIVEEILTAHSTGRPVLVGTASVRESDELFAMLSGAGLPCQVLNARHDATEAALIAAAGMLGAVTISTNMAGRGTDIKLGGELGWEQDKIKALGGLYVIGTNKHESVRIDNQLRGRAGRQGDPGESCFFISLEDTLITRYAIMEFIPPACLTGTESAQITNLVVAREITRAQTIIEDQNYTIRRTLRNYTALVDKQRQYIRMLRSEALKEQVIPETLWELCSTHYEQLCGLCGDATVKAALVHLYLHFIDQFWMEHLEYIDVLKEGIYLLRFGGKEPLLEFIKDISNSFAAGLTEAEKNANARFMRLTADNGALGWEALGIAAPAGTWTYQINDNPLPGFRMALIASNNIGFAAGSIMPLILLSPIILLAKIVKCTGKLVKKGWLFLQRRNNS